MRHLVGRNGIKPDPQNVEKIKNAKVSKNTIELRPYKKLGYVFYTFCIRFVYVFKKSTVFIRNWSIFHINYMFLILRFL